ncbi:hypothetical protein CU098_013654 [Rhizopus stolonifer]|uniref:Uncharacterized protein n=1 Tax=Rhizopus stolonifer TaxID=4846 RepID=A0A367KVU6_RHIST|nr:hypothetical protein CU098_013654 [Rhizopus stolonifer]
MDTTHTTHQNLTKETFCEIQRSQQDSSVNQWDLYPGARDGENFNMDQVRQRLHRINLLLHLVK